MNTARIATLNQGFIHQHYRAGIMGWITQSHRKSLLGQLLIDRNLISDTQLAKAIAHQQRTGQRLGDVFAEWNLISQKQIDNLLGKQRSLRLAASIAAALLAPLQAYASVAAAPMVPVTAQSSSAAQRQGGMRLLTEQELSETAGQGALDEALGDWLKLNQQFSYNLVTQNALGHQLDLLQKPNSGLKVLGDLGKLMNPVLMMLDSKMTIKDVVYDSGSASTVVNEDGSITLRLPSSIGEISFDNIRVRGSSGPSFGSIAIKGIDLRGTVVTVKAH